LNKNKQRAQPTNISPQDEEYLADTSEESTVPYVGSDRGKGKKRKIQVKGKQRVKTKKKI